jgi:hypothetical protein
MTQRALHAAQILWPAFIVAAILEMVVFAWVDPTQLRVGSWQPDAQTTYSVAFLTFWALVTLASLLSHWMMKSSGDPAQERLERKLAAKRRAQELRGPSRA